MRFIIVADIHFGSANDSGFSMESKYTEQAPEILKVLGEAAVAHGAEFIIHAGDMITEGTEQEIRLAAECCRALPVPFYNILGNHDCRAENFAELWLKNAGFMFPEGGLDTTFTRGGLRFDLLSIGWGRDSSQWIPANGFITHLLPEHFSRLRAGEQDIPRIIVCHSQIRPAYPRQTGLPNNIHVPTNGFDKIGDAIVSEFHPLLICGGHNHLNVLERLGSTYAATVSSLTEAPFEYKLLDFKDNCLSMKTCPLGGRVTFAYDYDPLRKFAQGNPCDREF